MYLYLLLTNLRNNKAKKIAQKNILHMIILYHSTTQKAVHTSSLLLRSEVVASTSTSLLGTRSTTTQFFVEVLHQL